jgi:hypothetical protein
MWRDGELPRITAEAYLREVDDDRGDDEAATIDTTTETATATAE